MKRHPPILLATLITVSAAVLASEAAPSVQVEMVPLRQQIMTESVSGYGVVSPDVRSQQTLSLPRPGQLASLLVSAGETVRKGTPLFEFGTDPAAALAYEQARQAVNFAKGEVKRIEQLVGQQLATQAQLASTRKALEDAGANLLAQQRLGAGKRIEQVVAPFDGVVLAVQAAQGDRLSAGAPVLQLARSGQQHVLLGVEPDDVQRVRVGMPARVMPVFSPKGEVTGRVVQVAGMINPQTLLVDVMIGIQGGGLMPGTRVRADIEVARRNEWVVPRSAVLRDEHGAYLFQVASDRAHRVNVRTDIETQQLIAIQGDFNPALPVVSLGNYELGDGMLVRGASR